jgi:hypothetical protein
MRLVIAAALVAATPGLAAADFYVMQNTQTRKCSVEQDYAATETNELLLKNKFMERQDAEAAMREIPGCG